MEQQHDSGPYESYDEDDWDLNDGMWWWDPESHPLRVKNEDGSYDLVFYDGNYSVVKQVPLVSAERNIPNEAAQGDGELVSDEPFSASLQTEAGPDVPSSSDAL